MRELILPLILSLVAAAPAHAVTPEDLQKHIIKKASYWSSYLKVPRLEERVMPAPPELVEFLGMDNQVNGFPETPRQAKVTPEFLADLKQAILELPEQVKSRIAPHLLGVFLIQDLGSSGFNDYVLDSKGEPAAMFVVLDVGNLNRTANDWFTWKESSPFKAVPGVELKGEIEPASGDNRKNALQFILLHELGHEVGLLSKAHPPWGLKLADVSGSEPYEFLRREWRVAGDHYERKRDSVEPLPGKLVYYVPQPDKPGMDRAPSFYDWLERTDFPTLYAATKPYDDFAESFATYVHSVLMKKPYRIRISGGGKVIKSFGLCWNESRCKEKRALLERYLGQ